MSSVAPMFDYINPGVGDDITGREIPVLDIPALYARSGEVAWVVKHMIPAESVGMMFGASGTFKSFVALDLALHKAHGLPWCGRKTEQGPVLYIAAEGGLGMHKRIQAWHARHKLSPAGAMLWVVPIAINVLEEAEATRDAALKVIDRPPSLVIVDTVSQTWDGDENSAQEMSRYLRALGTAFREKCSSAVMCIQHTGHLVTERPRGSSAQRANVDFLIGCHRDEKEMIATLSCSKQKDGETFDDVSFSLISHELGRDEDGDPITSLSAGAVMDPQEMAEIIRREAASGRSGRNAEILALVQNGMFEDDLRRAFYKIMDGNADTKSKAYRRAREWAIKAGYIDIAENIVLTLKKGF